MAETASPPTAPNQAQAMDRMYHLTRHVYDLTRKYYLLGRDQLLDQIAALAQPGDRVLEIGCGTARNLIGLQRRAPKAILYGLDASREMLATAEKNLHDARLADKITLRPELAENLHYATTFELDAPFDALYFSYSLSMIPTWAQALQAALANLKAGGTLSIVDFWDQGGLPPWFATMLQGWLRQFHVTHRPQLLTELHSWQQKGLGSLDIKPVARRYAYIAHFRKLAKA